MTASIYMDSGLQFCAVARRVGIGDDAAVDPRTELTYAVGRRTCAICDSRGACRDVLAEPQATLRDMKPTCPNFDLLHELMYRRLTRDSVNTC